MADVALPDPARPTELVNRGVESMFSFVHSNPRASKISTGAL